MRRYNRHNPINRQDRLKRHRRHRWTSYDLYDRYDRYDRHRTAITDLPLQMSGRGDCSVWRFRNVPTASTPTTVTRF